MTKLFLILFLSLSVQAFAGVINQYATHFKTTGSIQSFQWAPERYNSDFRYDVVYYIPDTLKDAQNVKTLMFMHGGGSSTMDRAGSLKTVMIYMSDMVRLANETQSVVVMPSANGLNWGGHTVGMIRDLNQLMRKELDVDHNNMGLGGHSMGGMGIGRSFMWLADEFSYFLPTAAGIDPRGQGEENINKMFNTPYVHLQGLKDHFQTFVEWCQALTKGVTELETKYGTKSKLEVLYYDGPHNYDFTLLKNTLVRLQSHPRNLYQNKLYGSLYYNDNFYTENNIKFHQGSNSRYFLVEMLEASGSTPERLDFRVEVKNNVIMLDLLSYPKQIKKIRLHLSKKMFSKEKQIELILNQVPAGKTMLQDYPYVDRIDRGYEFEDHLDVEL
jgi:hypothetical protein